MNQISIYEIIAINMIRVTKGLEPFRVGISAGRKEFEIARSIALKKLSDQSKYPFIPSNNLIFIPLFNIMCYIDV